MKTKKSLLIAPALGVLLLAAAGSVSGTVAWFSAVRVFSSDVGDFHVAQLEGNLECTVTADVGTVKLGDDSIGVGVDANGDHATDDSPLHYMLDASFEHVTNKYAYRLNSEGGSDKYVSYQNAAGGQWLYRSVGDPVTEKYYVAVSWTMTFSYEFGTVGNDVGIFLDLNAAKSKFKDPVYDNSSAPAAHNGLDSAKGMRIAFVPTVNGTTKIWGNHTPITGTDIPTFSTGETYEVGEKVLNENDNKIYVCKTAVASAGAWTGDTNWMRSYDCTLAAAEYDSGTSYTSKDIVKHDGKYWRNKADATGTWDGDKWDEVKELSNLRYVHGVSEGNVTEYTTNNYIYTQDLARAEDSENSTEDTALINRADYIGKILHKNRNNSDGTENLIVNCVAWFEGEDPNIVNNTAMAAVGANMTFYTRSFSTAEH